MGRSDGQPGQPAEGATVGDGDRLHGLLEAGHVAEGVGDVGVHVAELPAGRDQHCYHDESDQDQDECVFNHSLASLIGGNPNVSQSPQSECSLAEG
jgi:hypothetical protein